MIDERMQEQASLYVLGALDEAEAREFELAARPDPELAALVRELRTVSEALAGTAAAMEPSAAVKSRLLAALDAQAAPARRQTVTPWIAWAIAAGLGVVSFALLWQSNELHTQLAGQARRIDELTMSAALARAERDDLRQTVQLLRTSNRLANVRIALLSSLLAASPKALAVSLWDNDRQSGVFLVRNLKPAPNNKDYQLWIIDPRYPSPVDAGVFQVDAAGNVRVEYRAKLPIQTANQFAVTLERKGGADLPDTKATVLAGS